MAVNLPADIGVMVPPVLTGEGMGEKEKKGGEMRRRRRTHEIMT